MEHLKVVEMAEEDGYRFWSVPMPESWVEGYIAQKSAMGLLLSDIDCSTQCWCCQTRVVESN